MTHNEKEDSYVFDYTSIKRLLDQGGHKLADPIDVVDHYLSKDTRIRVETTGGQIRHFLQNKVGKKLSGVRVEESVGLSVEAARLLIPQAELVVKKQRYKLLLPSYLWIAVTVDFVELPLKVAVVECEVCGERDIPPLHQILGYPHAFTTCPFSAWDYFVRRIGICGAPSSGKSEVSRLFTTALNTTLDGNSFPVQEYATSFVQKYDRNPGFTEQILIYAGQRARELDAAKRSDIVVSDCPTFLSYIYAALHRGETRSSVNRLILSKLYKWVLLDLHNYTDMVFLRFQQYRENGIRFHDEATARSIDNQIEIFLRNHNVPHVEAHCEDWEYVLQQLFCFNTVTETEDGASTV